MSHHTDVYTDTTAIHIYTYTISHTHITVLPHVHMPHIHPCLRVQGLPNESFGSILAMGDASLISEPNKKEGVLPQTAQVAAQQGAYVARLFNRR